MGASTGLIDAVRRTHDGLSTRLDEARHVPMDAVRSRRGSPHIDALLAGTSGHLHAVDAVLVPCMERAFSRTHPLVRDYRVAARRLGVGVAHVKAHEFGSTYESGVSWPLVWSELEEALALERSAEEALAAQMTASLDDATLEGLATDLEVAEVRAPSRPHPYLPHRGRAGRLTRRLMRRVDSAWDHVEGRLVPQPVRRPHTPWGLVDRYFLASPRIDDEPEVKDTSVH